MVRWRDHEPRSCCSSSEIESLHTIIECMLKLCYSVSQVQIDQPRFGWSRLQSSRDSIAKACSCQILPAKRLNWPTLLQVHSASEVFTNDCDCLLRLHTEVKVTTLPHVGPLLNSLESRIILPKERIPPTRIIQITFIQIPPTIRRKTLRLWSQLNRRAFIPSYLFRVCRFHRESTCRNGMQQNFTQSKVQGDIRIPISGVRDGVEHYGLSCEGGVPDCVAEVGKVTC